MILTIIFLLIAAGLLVASFVFADPRVAHIKRYLRFGSIAPVVLAVIAFAFSIFTVVPASHVGVVTTFGKVSAEALKEGGHFVLPWQKVSNVYVGMDVAAAMKSEAASKDLQTVHSDLTVNFHVDPAKARDLYQLNPALAYKTAFVVPAMHEVFKSIVAQYTAEELVTKRQEVSSAISTSLNRRLAQYHLSAQTTNLVNFGFSRAFDAAIEEKVTASQKAETAKRNLDRVKFEAEQRIAAAEGEAKAIAIQAAAIEKQGGAAYTQLKAIERWDGKLPQYMGTAATPFIQLK